MNLARKLRETGQGEEKLNTFFSASFKALHLAPPNDFISFSFVLPQRGSWDTQEKWSQTYS